MNRFRSTFLLIGLLMLMFIINITQAQEEATAEATQALVVAVEGAMSPQEATLTTIASDAIRRSDQMMTIALFVGGAVTVVVVLVSSIYNKRVSELVPQGIVRDLFMEAGKLALQFAYTQALKTTSTADDTSVKLAVEQLARQHGYSVAFDANGTIVWTKPSPTGSITLTELDKAAYSQDNSDPYQIDWLKNSNDAK